MIISTTIKETRKAVNEWKREGLSVGLVPTMGFLHAGHASLVDSAKKTCDRVVASVFVNPTQFAPGEDLESYPRDFDHDTALLKDHGCDLVFHPGVDEMYGDGSDTFVEVLNDMPKKLCGVTRPTHFRGVCTVVSKLFNIVTPDKAFFGQKDAQQLAIIKRMAKDMSYGIEIIGCPIVREADGLALSSRNTYLNEKERKAAPLLSKSLALGVGMYAGGEKNAKVILGKMKEFIEKEPLAKIDYISAVNSETLEDECTIRPGTMLAMAVYIGKTRLIDNTIFNE